MVYSSTNIFILSIHHNKIIDSKAVLYQIYKIDYGKDKNSHFTKKSFNFNLEI